MISLNPGLKNGNLEGLQYAQYSFELDEYEYHFHIGVTIPTDKQARGQHTAKSKGDAIPVPLYTGTL